MERTMKILLLPEQWTDVPENIREPMKGLVVIVDPDDVDKEQGSSFWNPLFESGTVMVHKKAIIAALVETGKTLVARYWEGMYEKSLLAFPRGTYVID